MECQPVLAYFTASTSTTNDNDKNKCCLKKYQMIKIIIIRDKYTDLARELRKLWDMKVTVTPIVIGAHGTVPKSLERELEELETGRRIETIPNIILLRSARILRKFQKN